MKKKPPNNKNKKKQPQNHTRLKIPIERAAEILGRIVGRGLPPTEPNECVPKPEEKRGPKKDYLDEADGETPHAAKHGGR